MFTSLYVKTTLALENFKKDQRGVTAIEYAVIGVALTTIIAAVFSGTGPDSLQGGLTAGMAKIAAALK